MYIRRPTSLVLLTYRTGPYFVAGEYYRSNLREDQEGVPIWLDIEGRYAPPLLRISNRLLIQVSFAVVDVSTCEPVKENFVEVWATNATGVYAGVSSNGNGDGNASNLVSLLFLALCFNCYTNSSPYTSLMTLLEYDTWKRGTEDI